MLNQISELPNLSDIFDDFFPLINEIIDQIIWIFLIIIPWIKYLLASIFLIIGVLLIYKQHFNRKHRTKIKVNYYQPIIPEIWLAFIYLLLAFGIYTHILLYLMLWISELSPTPLIFALLKNFNLIEFAEMIIPYDIGWNNLTNFQQLAMLLIGLASISGGTSLIYGVLVYFNKGIDSKKKTAIPSIILVLRFGVFVIFLIEHISSNCSDVSSCFSRSIRA